MSSPEPAQLITSNRQPVIDYVTKDYDGFRQGMLNQIPLLMPNWTDRSESDFGVVLIELFAYVADILSYYQDRVANEAFLSTATQRRSVVELLRLIDYQIDPGLAASVFIHFDVSADASIAGSNIPYRLKTAGAPGETDQTFEVTQDFSLKLLNNAIDPTGSATIPAGLTSMDLPHSAHAIATGDYIYFEEKTTVSGVQKVRRSPILKVMDVQSSGINTDTLKWLPPLFEPYSTADTKLKGNNIIAVHGETVSDEPVFVGDGTPGQQMKLSRTPVTHVLKPVPSGRRRSTPELTIAVDGQVWQEVENFLDSSPADTHYTTSIDENDFLSVRFGDGERGSIPPAGAHVEATYRVGLGTEGNVGPDRLSVAITSVPQVTKISNPFSAANGADRESTDEARVSGPGLVITQERAVALEDYELLAKGFPGVGKAKARVGLRGGYKVVQVFVAPESPGVVPPPLPAPDVKSALKQYLESRMPVNRMAGVDVLDPVYVPVDISVDVYLKDQSSQTTVYQDVVAALRDLLSFANQDFGRSIRAGEVFAALYGVPGAAYTLLRRLARGGSPIVTGGCEFSDLAIQQNELAYQGALVVNLFGGLL